MVDLTDEEQLVDEMYGCEESPLFYKIKPKSTIEFVSSNKVSKKDFNDQDQCC